MGKKKFIIGGIIILIAVSGLGFIAFRNAATYYYTVSQVLGKAGALSGQTIRVAGPVADSSLVLGQTSANSVKFILLDRDDSQAQLTVLYQGSLPDAFKEGQDAVAEGKLTSSGIFDATQIIVKCPSKYQPQGQPGN